MLGLERRQGFRYSLEEIRRQPEKLAEFDKELRAAGQAGVAKMDVYQRKLMDLNNRFQAYLRLSNAFQPWDLPPFPARQGSRAIAQAALSGWIARVISAGNQAEREMDADASAAGGPAADGRRPAEKPTGSTPTGTETVASVCDGLQPRLPAEDAGTSPPIRPPWLGMRSSTPTATAMRRRSIGKWPSIASCSPPVRRTNTCRARRDSKPT